MKFLFRTKIRLYFPLCCQNSRPPGRKSNLQHSVLHRVKHLSGIVSLLVGEHTAAKLHAVCNACRPHGNPHGPLFFRGIDNRHSAALSLPLHLAVFQLCFSDVPALRHAGIGNQILFSQKAFYRTCAKGRVASVNPGHIPVKFYQLLILPSPGVGSPAVWIRPAAESCLVPIVQRGRPRPGHQHHNALSERAIADSLRSRLRSSRIQPPCPAVRPGHKPGMVMVGKLVHRRQPRGHRHIRPVIGHRAPEAVRIPQKILPEIVAVLLHSRQKPAHRLHKRIVIHHSIPLVALQPPGRVAVMLRQNERVRICLAHRVAEFFPETMVIFRRMSQIRRHVQPPAVRAKRRGNPFFSYFQNIIIKCSRRLII